MKRMYAQMQDGEAKMANHYRYQENNLTEPGYFFTDAQLAAHEQRIKEAAEENGARRMHKLLREVWTKGESSAPIQSIDTAMTMFKHLRASPEYKEGGK